ncbi:hypothetical protein [Streptomyces flavofungini]|uniref:hypothetical protein n=1 Tax=Streptomyces flavofungini TaxID=68200 RepID=UPI0025B1CE94|nr:hypothetical protein [Streptomyces flavofungini]WJV46692.1 hypothetical protein QUY26_14870 [Streptomyces flavofungini]
MSKSTAPTPSEREQDTGWRAPSRPGGLGRSATVTNHCGRTMRVKVVIKYGPDSRCFTLPPRHWARFNWTFGSYDKTVTC